MILNNYFILKVASYLLSNIVNFQCESIQKFMMFVIEVL